jgi:hypothetical protein
MVSISILFPRSGDAARANISFDDQFSGVHQTTRIDD